MTLPGRLRDIGLTGVQGTVRLRRRFGYPGRIDADEHVWLTFASVAGTAEVSLNGRRLGRIENGSGEFEATALLKERNILEVEFVAASDQDGLKGEVAMEIRAAAFLREVHMDASGRVSGQVVGPSAGPLDLYVLVDKKTAQYTSILPSPTGEPFSTRVPTGEVRVELIHGGVVWYAVDVASPAEPR